MSPSPHASLPKLTKDIGNFDTWIRNFCIHIGITSKHGGLASSPMNAVISDKNWPENPMATDPDHLHAKLLEHAMLHRNFPKQDKGKDNSDRETQFVKACTNEIQTDYYNHLLSLCDDHLVNIVTQQVQQDDLQAGTKAFVILHSLCAVNNEVTQAAALSACVRSIDQVTLDPTNVTKILPDLLHTSNQFGTENKMSIQRMLTILIAIAMSNSPLATTTATTIAQAALLDPAMELVELNSKITVAASQK